MRQCKTFIAQSDDKEEVTLQLQVLSAAEPLEEDAKRKRLVAAAAAYVAVHLRGRVLVSLKKDATTVKVIQRRDGAGDLEADFSEHLVYEEPSLLRSRRKTIRRNAMVQMLMERTVLADTQSAHSDRIMLGASQLLCKYVTCSFVWMEVCMKLAAAALVSVVGSKDGFWLSGAILLGMALVVGIARPYARPQVNALQTSCFACLALAAAGFHLPALGYHTNWRRLAYLALALPALQLLLSLLRPDSSEALALRLHKELEEKLLDGPAEVSAEDLKFL